MRQLKITKQVTNREAPSLDKYLQEIGKVKLITADEEVKLAKRIKLGDDAALTKLVNANLRFVVSVSKQYQNQGISLSDLINEGNLGLIKAAQRFDETRGFKFISYAVWWIRQAILQALAEQGRIVRLPLNKIGSMNKVSSTLAALEQEYQREPTPEEIATILDMTPHDVKESLAAMNKHVSMDAPVHKDEDNNNMYDTVNIKDDSRPDGELLSDSLGREIDRSLSSLSTREADIIRLYYGLTGEPPYSLEDIGNLFSLTRERVRQIKEKTIKRMQHNYRSKVLRSYLG